MVHATVGFVGLGRMGTPMVSALAASGFPVVAYDLVPQARDRAAEVAGVRVAGSLRDVGATAGIVITMLPDGAAVAGAVLGDERIAADLAAGSTIIDMSSSAPWETTALGERLAERGIRLVDAPVSGGVPRAITGELSIFAGGEPDAVDAVVPVLEAMGNRIHRTGGLGTGHAAKALNNLVSAACFAATIEGVRLAEQQGIDPEVMAEVLNTSTGRNNTTDVKLRQYVLSGSFDSGFALSLMVKDLKQSGIIADRSGLDVPLTRQIIELWSAAADQLEPTADHTEMAKLLAARRPS